MILIALLQIYAQDILQVGSVWKSGSATVGSVIIMFISAHIPLTKNMEKIVVWIWFINNKAFGVVYFGFLLLHCFCMV